MNALFPLHREGEAPELGEDGLAHQRVPAGLLLLLLGGLPMLQLGHWCWLCAAAEEVNWG